MAATQYDPAPELIDAALAVAGLSPSHRKHGPRQIVTGLGGHALSLFGMASDDLFWPRSIEELSADEVSAALLSAAYRTTEHLKDA